MKLHLRLTAHCSCNAGRRCWGHDDDVAPAQPHASRRGPQQSWLKPVHPFTLSIS